MKTKLVAISYCTGVSKRRRVHEAVMLSLYVDVKANGAADGKSKM